MSFDPWMGWALAAGLYVIFRVWYDNWRGPLRPHEIESFMARAEALWPEAHELTAFAPLATVRFGGVDWDAPLSTRRPSLYTGATA